MPTMGSHLLGRVAPEPDKRDYKLSKYLNKKENVSGDDLDRALSLLLNTKGAAVTTKNFAKAITSHVRALETSVGPQPPATTAVLWDNSDTVLDQADTGHCVGFGHAQWGNTDPVDDNYANNDGHDIYYEAKVIDGEPKAENGTSVHSGIKAMKNRKRVTAYAWTSAIPEMKQWVLTKGSLIIGSDWYTGMFNPDTNGFIKPSGVVEGGHCYIIIGWDDADNLTILNSWGSGWGKGGRAFIKSADFGKLINPGFEACAAVELP